MAETQPDLDFTTPAPKVAPWEVQHLCAMLRGRGWQTAAQILSLEVDQFAAGPNWSDRKVRAIAEASDGAVVSYPGSPGYILFDEARREEIAHAVAAMQSQGKRMLARALALDRRDRQRRLVDRPQP